MLQILSRGKRKWEFVTKGSVDASAPNTSGTAVHGQRGETKLEYTQRPSCLSCPELCIKSSQSISITLHIEYALAPKYIKSCNQTCPMNIHTFAHKAGQMWSTNHQSTTDSVKMHAMHRCVQTKSTQRKYSVQLHCNVFVLWCIRQQGLKPFTLLVLFGPMELVQKEETPGD